MKTLPGTPQNLGFLSLSLNEKQGRFGLGSPRLSRASPHHRGTLVKKLFALTTKRAGTAPNAGSL
jgi:hypothetical protein